MAVVLRQQWGNARRQQVLRSARVVRPQPTECQRLSRLSPCASTVRQLRQVYHHVDSCAYSAYEELHCILYILTLTYDLDFQSEVSCGHGTPKKLKFKGQSVQEMERKQTDMQTDATSYFTFPANVVSNYTINQSFGSPLRLPPLEKFWNYCFLKLLIRKSRSLDRQFMNYDGRLFLKPGVIAVVCMLHA